MNIRCLPHLNTREAWLAFCQRELPYCFIEQPECLVDFQTTYLMITLLDGNTRNGKQATKYSLGSRSSLEPAWNFIKACSFDLGLMVDGLNQVNFDSNVRDNSFLKAHTDLTVRKFFSKERSIISPSHLGRLLPLRHPPAHWDLYSACALLAHNQFRELRTEQMALPGNDQFMVEFKGIPAPEVQSMLSEMISAPQYWQVLPHPNDSRRVIINRDQAPLCSFEPVYEAPKPKMAQRVPRWAI